MISVTELGYPFRPCEKMLESLAILMTSPKAWTKQARSSTGSEHWGYIKITMLLLMGKYDDEA